jgi:hypothetical protein
MEPLAAERTEITMERESLLLDPCEREFFNEQINTDLTSSPYRLGEPVELAPPDEHVRYYCPACNVGGRHPGRCEIHPEVELEDSWAEGFEPQPVRVRWWQSEEMGLILVGLAVAARVALHVLLR